MLKTMIGLVVAAVAVVWFLVGAAKPPAYDDTNSRGDLVVATFAGGCFWCVESDFEKVPGVVKVISGYTGGQLANPTYEQVAGGGSGHLESVQVYYDPQVITYEGLLEAFWRIVNPTDAGGQFPDRGAQYATAIFYHDAAQKEAAESSRAALEASGRYQKPVITPIRSAGEFYPAEGYHQDYRAKNPLRYKLYRYNSGRDQYLKKTWGEDLHVDYRKHAPAGAHQFDKPSDEQLRASLTPLQYDVTQRDATEPPFDNKFWDEKRDGIYVDVVSGEPLFSSKDKFDSGTGWPSFTRPLEPASILAKTDYKLLFPRTEVRSRNGDSHLGHLFDDGPAPTGLRFCINSASLRFIPKDELEQEGYGQYAGLFE